MSTYDEYYANSTTDLEYFIPDTICVSFSQATMIIMIGKLSGESKAKAMITRTEGKGQNSCQGQSIASETFNEEYNLATSSQHPSGMKRYADTPQKCGDVG